MTKLPDPEAGLVIRYSYLWHNEHQRGIEEGRKDRPVAIVTAVKNKSGKQTVIVAPVTHTPPQGDQKRLAIEIPIAVKKRLGLDDKPSWIITNDVNTFEWPGPDIRPLSRVSANQFAYGHLPQKLTNNMIENIKHHAKVRQLAMTRRDDGKGQDI